MYTFSVAVDFNGVTVLLSILMPASRTFQYICIVHRTDTEEIHLTNRDMLRRRGEAIALLPVWRQDFANRKS